MWENHLHVKCTRDKSYDVIYVCDEVEEIMEEIILFGAGQNLPVVLKILGNLNIYRVLEIWDNSASGKDHIQYVDKSINIVAPHHINRSIHILIIPNRYEREIKAQLMNDLKVNPKMIKSWWYVFHDVKKIIVDKYMHIPDIQIKKIVEYLKDHDLHTFNGGLYEKYQYSSFDVDIQRDESNGLLYYSWKGKKLYLKRDYSRDSAKNYINSLHMEQDIMSCHCYEQKMTVGREYDVIVDAGAAEGFFSLERVATAKHIYLVESDKAWIEALEYTFAPYKEKVTIIPKYLGDCDDDAHVSIDWIDSIGIPITVIKMDIEGAELEGLRGGDNTLLSSRKLDILACAYHNSTDAAAISRLLLEQHFAVSFTDGYMFFAYGKDIIPELRHGLVCGRKH